MKLIDILSKKKYSTDKHTVHRYIQEFYEDEFKQFSDRKIRLLEIGVLTGGSLKLWHDYFTGSDIVGLDIFKRVPLSQVKKEVAGYKIQLEVIDSFNKDEELKKLRDTFILDNKDRGFDIIIDDGLHTDTAQYETFLNFSSLMNSKGIYVIEDVRVSSIKKLSKISNIEFIELNEGSGSRVRKQHIAVVRF